MREFPKKFQAIHNTVIYTKRKINIHEKKLRKDDKF